MKTNKKRDPSCTRRVKRHTSELGAGHGVLAEGIRLPRRAPKRKRGMYSGSQCQASSMLQSAKQQGTDDLGCMHSSPQLFFHSIDCLAVLAWMHKQDNGGQECWLFNVRPCGPFCLAYVAHVERCCLAAAVMVLFANFPANSTFSMPAAEKTRVDRFNNVPSTLQLGHRSPILAAFARNTLSSSGVETPVCHVCLLGRGLLSLLISHAGRRR